MFQRSVLPPSSRSKSKPEAPEILVDFYWTTQHYSSEDHIVTSARTSNPRRENFTFTRLGDRASQPVIQKENSVPRKYIIYCHGPLKPQTTITLKENKSGSKYDMRLDYNKQRLQSSGMWCYVILWLFLWHCLDIDSVASNGGMTDKWWIGKDLEWDSPGLTEELSWDFPWQTIIKKTLG